MIHATIARIMCLILYRPEHGRFSISLCLIKRIKPERGNDYLGLLDSKKVLHSLYVNISRYFRRKHPRVVSIMHYILLIIKLH